MIPAVMAIGSVMTYKPLSIQPLGLTAGAGAGWGGGGGGCQVSAWPSARVVIAIGDATGATGRDRFRGPEVRSAARAPEGQG